MTTQQQDATENLKRKIAELDACIQEFEAIKRVSSDDDSLKKLKTLTDKLVQTYKTLKGPDGRDELWDNGLSLKLTGFKHGLDPKPINVKGYFKNLKIEVKSSILIHDHDYGKDFVLIEFKSTADVEKALKAKLRNFPATCPGGISMFDGQMAKLRE
jgi:hypothetical protein